MPDQVTFDLDLDSLRGSEDSIRRGVFNAGARSIRTTTRNLERKLEEATRNAVPGRLWRAWASKAYPTTGGAVEPVGTIYLKGGARTRGAIQFWTQSGSIRGKSGQYLAVPLPAAGSRGRSRDLTPGEWERRTGIRLRFVYRPGKPALLVADEATLSGKGKIARQNTAKRRATGRGNTTVPIFVLLPMVKFGNAFAIEPIVNASEGELATEFFNAIRTLQSGN